MQNKAMLGAGVVKHVRIDEAGKVLSWAKATMPPRLYSAWLLERCNLTPTEANGIILAAEGIASRS